MNIVLLLGLVLVASATVGASQTGCTGNDCTPKYSSFDRKNDADADITGDLQEYNSQLILKSFHFLFTSAEFNKYEMDRPGFEKLYRKISDKAWEDAIELIKYRSRRGAEGYLAVPKDPLNQLQATKEGKDKLKLNVTITIHAVDEPSSLRTALDIEKEMAKKAHEIHQQVSHDHKTRTKGLKIHYDPDTAHYLDEKIISYQSGVIRDLAGYVQTFDKITKGQTERKTDATDLAAHLFDEYLHKEL